MRKSALDLTGPTRLWHGAYCRWYDHDRAGRPRRASAWGWVADRIVRWA